MIEETKKLMDKMVDRGKEVRESLKDFLDWWFEATKRMWEHVHNKLRYLIVFRYVNPKGKVEYHFIKVGDKNIYKIPANDFDTEQFEKAEKIDIENYDFDIIYHISRFLPEKMREYYDSLHERKEEYEKIIEEMINLMKQEVQDESKI